MNKLNDLQSILLATGAARESGSLYPVADSAAAAGVRLTRAVNALIKAGLVEEREVGDVASTHRTDGDLGLGLFVTAAGLQAIGIEPQISDAGQAPSPAQAASAPATAAPRGAKAAQVLALLGRPGGATLPELIAATGWLPHTTRAALTGLRKKGHAVDRTKRDGATCYRIVVAG